MSLTSSSLPETAPVVARAIPAGSPVTPPLAGALAGDGQPWSRVDVSITLTRERILTLRALTMSLWEHLRPDSFFISSTVVFASWFCREIT